MELQESERSESKPLSELSGLTVYTIDGTIVGTVDCPVVSFDENRTTGLSITNCNSDLFLETPPQTVVIPYRWVRSIDDIVLVVPIDEEMIQV